MIELMKMAFFFSCGFLAALALYVVVAFLVYKLAAWAWEEITWKLILWRSARNEKRERWEREKADLIAYTEKAAGE